MAWAFPEFQFLWLAEETKKNLPLELDFIHEAHNCERVSRMFSHFSFLKVGAPVCNFVPLCKVSVTNLYVKSFSKLVTDAHKEVV